MDVLKKAWSVGFTKITSMEQADKAAKCCASVLFACIIGIMIFGGSHSTDIKGSLPILLIWLVFAGAIYKNKSRVISILLLVIMIFGIWVLNADIGPDLWKDSFLALLIITVFFCSLLRAIYATFKYHQLTPKG